MWVIIKKATVPDSLVFCAPRSITFVAQLKNVPLYLTPWFFSKNIINLSKSTVLVIEEVNRKLGLAEGIISKIMREEKEK